MFATRLAKVVMVTSLAAFAFIVTFDNVTDYASNFDFVRHVLTMDTTFPNNALLYRSIKQPPLWHVAYLTIIAAVRLDLSASHDRGRGLATHFARNWGRIR